MVQVPLPASLIFSLSFYSDGSISFYLKLWHSLFSFIILYDSVRYRYLSPSTYSDGPVSPDFIYSFIKSSLSLYNQWLFSYQLFNDSVSPWTWTYSGGSVSFSTYSDGQALLLLIVVVQHVLLFCALLSCHMVYSSATPKWCFSLFPPSVIPLEPFVVSLSGHFRRNFQSVRYCRFFMRVAIVDPDNFARSESGSATKAHVNTWQLCRKYYVLKQ